MKIIINENQLRLIIENEDNDNNLMDFTTGENLIDLTGVYELGTSPNKWDDMFEHLNKKKGGKYDGYYIDGDVYLNNSNFNTTQLKYLVKVHGFLYLSHIPIESLPMLKYVGGNLEFSNTPIKSLPMLEYVSGSLFFVSTQIESLPMLSYVGNNLGLLKSNIKSLPMLTEVGGYLDLRDTPLSKTTTKEELREQINFSHIFL